jgi:predicted dinucleotide-utilizing enzyme
MADIVDAESRDRNDAIRTAWNASLAILDGAIGGVDEISRSSQYREMISSASFQSLVKLQEVRELVFSEKVNWAIDDSKKPNLRFVCFVHALRDAFNRST